MGDSMTLTQADFDTLQNERDLERDAYEARIAELTAELARVKAESLRVVPDGEAFDIDDLPGWEHIINDLYTYDGRTYINIDDERCYKVRLERWETEDGN